MAGSQQCIHVQKKSLLGGLLGTSFDKQRRASERNPFASSRAESGVDKLKSEANQSDDEVVICERCKAEDASVVCLQCGGVKLCESCQDLIHSLGVFESHKRIPVAEYE